MRLSASLAAVSQSRKRNGELLRAWSPLKTDDLLRWPPAVWEAVMKRFVEGVDRQRNRRCYAAVKSAAGCRLPLVEPSNRRIGCIGWGCVKRDWRSSSAAMHGVDDPLNQRRPRGGTRMPPPMTMQSKLSASDAAIVASALSSGKIEQKAPPSACLQVQQDRVGSGCDRLQRGSLRLIGIGEVYCFGRNADYKDAHRLSSSPSPSCPHRAYSRGDAE